MYQEIKSINEPREGDIRLNCIGDGLFNIEMYSYSEWRYVRHKYNSLLLEPWYGSIISALLLSLNQNVAERYIKEHFKFLEQKEKEEKRHELARKTTPTRYFRRK